jgi:hypothetical protein
MRAQNRADHDSSNPGIVFDGKAVVEGSKVGREAGTFD